MQFTRVFIHGLESTSQGTKGLYFRARYPGMLIGDYEGPLESRMAQLNRELGGKQNLILVGSSFGGLMAAIHTCTHPEAVQRLILLAPALSLPDFEPYLSRAITTPVIVYHGRSDDVVPISPVKIIAEKVFSNLAFHMVEDDHSLHETFPAMNWDELLLKPDR
jgi:pimeloyl-ACP methyl ester carboxylesterase